MPRVRTFVAVEIGESARAALAQLLSRLKKQEMTVKWIRPGNLHWTLAFLGELEADRIEAVHQVCQTAAQATTIFHLALGSLGRFPAKGKPRVIWIGLSQGAEALTALQASLAKGLKEKGFSLDDRGFVPHLTLGRVPRDVCLPAQPGWLNLSLPDSGSIPVAEVRVMRSALSPDGAKYSQLYACPLSTGDNRE